MSDAQHGLAPAAWLVAPPLAVTTACAASMPRRSCGLCTASSKGYRAAAMA